MSIGAWSFWTLTIWHILYTSELVESKLESKKAKKIASGLALRNWDHLHNKMSRESSKLDLYCSIKRAAAMSPHLLSSLSPRQKSAITKLRIRANNLPIVTGRYLDIPRVQRTCPLCCADVGSESHYLTECRFQQFQALRLEMFAMLQHQLTSVNDHNSNSPR